ncbi:3-hydroxyacyl-ACP dehydratase FabZ [Brochothrix thermosphacta]|uniref:3-hydroxyacyl-ACP dehydratase FabZ n=1 Tax=Brochothrix thermosphacta TaxID=2756 RepID=UPI0039B03CB8
MMTSNEIKQALPHRYPFLLVDRVIEVEAGKQARAYKNVSHNDPFFEGHFPQFPVMPGVLILEALAQTAGLAMANKEETNKIGLFAGVDKCRFKKQVVPGDQLHLAAEITRQKGTIAKAHVIATVDGEIACEADIMFAMAEV